jgi:tRNA(fMet)-specific endonuclease VapC
MTHLLDTNVCIDVLRGESSVIDRIRTLSPDDCVISSITYFELISGARKASHPDREASKIHRLASTLLLQSFDCHAAEQAAMIRTTLENAGRKIGAYDALIAGHAMALGLICVTNNVREFSRVQGLQIENWRE